MSITYPRIAPVGLSGVLVSFGAELTDRANLAAIAFRAEVDKQNWPEVGETAATLVSTYLDVDLVETAFEDIRARLMALLGTRDWLSADPPEGRLRWTIPVCFEGSHAPQLEQAAEQAGLSPEEARESLAASVTRVMTIGYAPGQPYLGLLPERWDIPRLSGLTPQVPAGALVVAIRQIIFFTAATPTGWQHVGQAAFRPFDPDRDRPLAFNSGDEVRITRISETELNELEQGDSWGGATREPIP